MATRTIVTPETYSGDGPFDAWIEHFERAAALNEWSEDQQAQWLTVRLVGRAQIALRVGQGNHTAIPKPVVSPHRPRNGKLRFCVDYRKLNAVTRKDAYPIPRIDDTLDNLAGSQWFSTLDLISGYWQVELNDRQKTAFSSPDGLFEFNVMPFGLCNAPATFQRLMDRMLAGMNWKTCMVYLDDIIILSNTPTQHR